jgi:hypothetical protein
MHESILLGDASVQDIQLELLHRTRFTMDGAAAAGQGGCEAEGSNMNRRCTSGGWH